MGFWPDERAWMVGIGADGHTWDSIGHRDGEVGIGWDGMGWGVVGPTHG
jgi:hypothetical protein